MPSESRRESWHPAFMPNSADIIVANKPEPALPSTPRSTLGSLVESSKPYVDAAVISNGNEDREVVADVCFIDKVSLRSEPEFPPNFNDVLPASSNNPCETIEARDPNGIVHDNITEDQFHPENPSQERSPSKHLSTISFTRTVSEEVNWTEDEDLDSEWNLNRTDTDPFKFMAKSDRTNSFPSVPAREVQERPRRQSQEVHVMNGVEQESRESFDELEPDMDADFFNMASHANQLDDTSLHDAHNGASGWFSEYSRAYGGNPMEQEHLNEEARFEEGLPLVHPHEQVKPQQWSSTFADKEASEEDQFLGKGSRSDEMHQKSENKPDLERKSTMQVMGSLNFNIHEQTPSLNEKNVLHPATFSEQGADAEIATSNPTFTQEVPGRSCTPTRQSDILANSDNEFDEEELAAKWQAALAGDVTGDDFLEDEDGFLTDDDVPTDLPADSGAIDSTAIFRSDGKGFDDTDAAAADLFGQPTNIPVPAPISSSNDHMKSSNGFTLGTHTSRPTSDVGSKRYLPSGATIVPFVSSKGYAPSGPQFTDLSRPSSTSVGLSAYAPPTISNFQPTQPQRPSLPKAQSYVNMSKGGYSSPYDLPMEVVPKKRVSTQQINRATPPIPTAPPRSSSISNQPATTSVSTISGPRVVPKQLQQTIQGQPKTENPVQKPQGGFFEDLPISSRPKIATRRSGIVSSSLQNQCNQPSNTGPPPTAARRSDSLPTIRQHPAQSSIRQGLIAPERVSPYASLPATSVAQPAIVSRHPTAPPLVHSHSTSMQNVSQSRYSPALVSAQRQQYAAPPSTAASLPQQTQTSNPSAQFERSQNTQSQGTHSRNISFDRRSSSGYESGLRSSQLPPTRELDETEQSPVSNETYGDFQAQQIYQPSIASVMVSPSPQDFTLRLSRSPPKNPITSYVPQQPCSAIPPNFAPPQRSRTQSPGSASIGTMPPTMKFEKYKRPASVEPPFHATKMNVGFSSMQNVITVPQEMPNIFSPGTNYITPIDGREHDPLQRWKGSPVFAWGVGGTIITSFPKDVPRYNMNQTAPMIVRSPGEVKIRSIKDLDPLNPRLAMFPGPLRGKSKKKEILAWLTSGIELLEAGALHLHSSPHPSHDDKRVEERVLLWKILRVFIEHDGNLEGTPTLEKAVRAILSPKIDDDSSTDQPMYATGAELSGISQSSKSTTRADNVDPTAVDELRKYLLRGEREKAVWKAVDKRLWAHAMLISHTVSLELYKQVAQEFVQKEVKVIGDNTQSLAALYDVFAGNFEESVDELVPPSARAGFQMVSTSNEAEQSKDALAGLDRWQETLGLVLSNRSVEDSRALIALGRLLSGYGRAEAAHICFLFARSQSSFDGIDNPLSSIVLVGSDQLRQPYDFNREVEPILLSEVFEYGLSLSNQAAMAISSPHLSIYKLQYAKVLAEYGFREKALLYCEAIAASITSQTRRSPYHHNLLVSELDDFNKRLKQSPKDESGSWISKPSIDKAKGSVWATFNKFVAGDEADAAVTGSGLASGTEAGPFSRIAGSTPTISRSPSTTELYSPYNSTSGMNGKIHPPLTEAASRYAPVAPYNPGNQEPHSASSHGSQSRRSMEGGPSSEYNRYNPQRSQFLDSHKPNSQSNPQSGIYLSQINSGLKVQSSNITYGSGASPYEPAAAHTPQTPVQEQVPADLYNSPHPLSSVDGQQQPILSYEPSSSAGTTNFGVSSNNYKPPSNSYEPPSSNYDSPSNGYEPPSYQPAAMDDEADTPVETRSKKKSFIDDDDDDILALREKPAQEKTKAEKDREADEAFRRAAEADSLKAKEAAPAKKGWGLGSWFGVGAKKEADTSSQSNKPIRAKLGEASSFHYDPDLKRWVNKKAGAEKTEPKNSMPPPPKASGPPRSGSVPPPSIGPVPVPSLRPPPPISQGAAGESLTTQVQNNSIHPSPHSGADAADPLLPPGPVNMARTVSNNSVAPPSRPGTSMSNASSIDDLLGPPTLGRKVGAKVKKRGRGYIDVMGDKAAS